MSFETEYDTELDQPSAQPKPDLDDILAEHSITFKNTTAVSEDVDSDSTAAPTQDSNSGFHPFDTAMPMTVLKGKLEACLFVTGKALQLNEIAEIVEASADDVEMALGELIQDYAFRDGCGLEIDDTDGYILQVREDYGMVVNKMLPLELSPAMLRTLSAIAIKSPILQADLIELRGSSAYDHIAALLTQKMISKKRQGRSFVLNVTRNFYDYFKIQGDKKELEFLLRTTGKETSKRALNAEENTLEIGAEADAETNETLTNVIVSEPSDQTNWPEAQSA